jgi:SecD/SecF fusion protein
MPPYVNAIIVVALMVVPFFLGGYFAKMLRMPDFGWKIGLILWTLFCSTAIVTMYWPPKLGIDLSGGMILIYEVDKAQLKPGQTINPDMMDKLISAISKRINPGGVKEINIRKYGSDGVEIVIPDVDEAAANRVADLVSRVGTLEFRILANTTDDNTLIERAKSDLSKNLIRDSQGNRLAWWVPITAGQEASFNYPEICKRERTVGTKKVTDVLVIQDTYNVTGDYLDYSSPSTDRSGKPCVGFQFNSRGGQLFGMLTGDNKPDETTGFKRKLGIVLDGQLYSAPAINDVIHQQGVIEGGSFTRESVQQQVDVLNAGALPATLTQEPISKLFCGPTLGSDTIHKSTMALIIASVLVPLFMLWYYRFSGVIADIVLILNILILLAIMISVKAAFTLPGFAGFALTVGMAVDNNVLVYERLREELARGAALRMAIRNAFQRASATIIDCNITHLIAAVVLYAIAPEQIKGFAVVLFLGVSISMFTSVFVARVLFDIAEKHRWITELKMRHLIGHTEIDFMGLFPYCLTFSIFITVLGLAVAFWRGPGLLDIDFTGGASVQTLFNEPQQIAEVRGTLEKMPKEFPDVTISEVRFGKETEGLRFEVNTSNTNIGQVKEELQKVFQGKLVTNAVTVKDIAPITSTVPEKGPAMGPSPGEKPVEKVEPATTPAEPAVPPVKSDEKNENKDKQSRSRLKSRGIMAIAAALPLMFGQVEAPASTPTTPAAAAQEKTNTQPEEIKEKAAAPALTEEKAVEKSPGETATPGAVRPTAEIVDPFSSGTQAQLNFSQKLDHQAVVDMVNNAFKKLNLENKDIPLDIRNDEYSEGDQRSFGNWTIKIGLPAEKAQEVFDLLKQSLGAAPYFPASNAIGGAVATNTQYLAFYALMSSWILIILYLWIRFQGVAFGLAAVIALVHDVLVMLGAIAFSYYLAPYFGWLYIDPFKINLPIIAAFLTIIGYSVNDTIVVFDRIREVRGKDPNMTREMINLSTNQTLSRTILTSLTVFMVVVVLYFFAGQALRGFSFALIVGVVTGTYSSIYVAAPILLWLIGRGKTT